MKKISKIFAFITVNIFIIIFYIYKESKIIKLSYRKQKLEKIVKELNEQKQKLEKTLHVLKNPTQIKKFAENTLKMKKINLKQIKRISLAETHLNQDQTKKSHYE